MKKSECLANYIASLNEQNFTLDYLDKKFTSELYAIATLDKENISKIKLKKSNDLLKIYLIYATNVIDEEEIDENQNRFIKFAEVDLSTELLTIDGYERYNIYLTSVLNKYEETKSSIIEDINKINNKNKFLKKIFKNHYKRTLEYYTNALNLVNTIENRYKKELNIFDNNHTIEKIIQTFIEETNFAFGIKLKVMSNKNSFVEMENKK